MTDMPTLRAAAATARAASMVDRPTALPCGEAHREDVKFHAEFRSELVERDGQEYHLVEGYASTVEQRYEMWDFFGPYEEVVSREAFNKTLDAKPMVVFRFNHGGTAMATTSNGRLELEADALGLRTKAWINPKRADVRDLLTAMEDHDVTEQSFMFQITNGEWNEDFSEFRINEVDLDRGDVGPVTYGANPHTMVAARSGELLAAIPDMPVLVAREAMTRLRQRPDLATPADLAAVINKHVGEATRAELQQAFAPLSVEAEAAAHQALRDAEAAYAAAALTVDGAAIATSLQGIKAEPPKTPDAPKAPVGSSLRLRLAQLEVDKQFAQE